MELYLRRYLLGALPEEDLDVTDEAVVTNDDVAALLCAVEFDLVDEYVCNRLVGDLLERFESWYLASPRRRAKVRFAACLLRIADG